jgi:hypothetical protein
MVKREKRYYSGRERDTGRHINQPILRREGRKKEARLYLK